MKFMQIKLKLQLGGTTVQQHMARIDRLLGLLLGTIAYELQPHKFPTIVVCQRLGQNEPFPAFPAFPPTPCSLEIKIAPAQTIHTKVTSQLTHLLQLKQLSYSGTS